MLKHMGTLQLMPLAGVLIPACQLVRKSLGMLKAMNKKEEGVKKPKRLILGTCH